MASSKIEATTATTGSVYSNRKRIKEGEGFDEEPMQQSIARSIVVGIIVTGPASASTPEKAGLLRST
jgi:hypothetical protein